MFSIRHRNQPNVFGYRLFFYAYTMTLCLSILLATNTFASPRHFDDPTTILYDPMQSHTRPQHNYTLLEREYLQAVHHQSTQEIQQIIRKLNHIRQSGLTRQQQQEASVKLISDVLQHRPYIAQGAEGEGEWSHKTTRGVNKQHIKQDPIYRTDGFDCATFVQTVLALLNSSTFDEFVKTIIKVQYGAAGLAKENAVHYCNRNNFTSKDFNRINQQHGYIKDVTGSPVIPIRAKTQATIIDPIQWLAKQSQGVMAQRYHVRVLDPKSGSAMVKRFSNDYAKRYCPALKPEKVSIAYLPKQALTLVTKTSRGISYKPNRKVINKIPTPAIVEFIRDDNKWKVNGIPIKQKLNTGLLVSHIGLLHKQSFKQHQLIYRQTSCKMNRGMPTCTVTPVYCMKKQCVRMMFTHATDAFPNNYYYYKKNNQYYCSRQKPSKGTPYTYCNRVISLPLGDYLTQKQYGRYLYMTAPSILGINIQKIN